jgi:3-phenylpropionate/trans-cinnamate dioxygenase ferredoxin reductase subunit
MQRIVVAGGGLAAARAVEALRARGYEGALTMVSAEPHAPYDRPPLSKAVLRGDTDDTALDVDLDSLGCELLPRRRATGLRPAAAAAGAGQDGMSGPGEPSRAGAGTGAEAGAGGVLDTDGGPLGYDGLVIATGSVPFRLPGDGPQRVLRTIEDALALRAALVPGARVAIVGAGWIGAEVATAAAAAGCRVTVVEAGPAPLAMAVGAEVGGRTARWYADAGIDLRCGVKVAAVDAGGLALTDGGRVDADEVVTGVGVRPAVDWLAGSGIALADGIVVDAALRTNLPGVVAAGDCAAWWSRRYGRRLRVEHWDTALKSPDVAAATLLGQEAAYDPVPYFWSEQHGRMVQYAGHHQVGTRLVWRGDPGPQSGSGSGWTACWLAGQDRLVAVVAVDRPRDLVQARRIIDSGVSIDPERLIDPTVPIRESVRH